MDQLMRKNQSINASKCPFCNAVIKEPAPVFTLSDRWIDYLKTTKNWRYYPDQEVDRQYG